MNRLARRFASVAPLLLAAVLVVGQSGVSARPDANNAANNEINNEINNAANNGINNEINNEATPATTPSTDTSAPATGRPFVSPSLKRRVDTLESAAVPMALRDRGEVGIVVRDVPQTLGSEAANSTTDSAQSAAAIPGIELDRDYPLLGLSRVRISGRRALDDLAADPTVRAIVEDATFVAETTETAPVVRAPQAHARGYGGAGAFVAVIDSGADYLRFGCSGVAVPITCPITLMPPDFSTDDFGTTVDDGELDDSGHGTNVAGIVAAIAPDTRIIAVDVFRKIPLNGGTVNATKTSDIAAAMQYILQLKQAGYPVSAVNLSLGSADGTTLPCVDSIGQAALNSAGIVTVAAAGNAAKVNGLFRPGLSNPACIPGVVAVGATYDSASTPVASCGDTAPVAPDQITCFSQASTSLSLLAPGRSVTAAGLTYSGTSQAAPHVAAAVAVLAGFAPHATTAQVVNALRNSGPLLFDSRVPASFRRLDIDAALTTLAAQIGATNNDYFDQPVELAGGAGTLTTAFGGTTAQGGEGRHGDRNGERTAWYRWTATSNGTFSVSTSGSSFDTAISLYTGTRLGQMTERAANDTSGVDPMATLGPVEVSAGTTYRIAVVCGQDLASCGNLTLTWSSAPVSAAPANDTPQQALTLTTDGALAAVNAFATSHTGETPADPADLSVVRSHSIWYRIPGRRGRLSVSTAGSNFDTTLTAYTGPDPQHLVVTGRSDDVGPVATGIDRTSRLNVPTSALDWTWIAVDGFNGQTGTVNLAWSTVTEPVPQAPTTVAVTTLVPAARGAVSAAPGVPSTRPSAPRSGEGPVAIP